MQEERRLEILGILIIALSVFVLVSIGGYNPSEEPSISPNVQVTNPMGILGIFTAHIFIKLSFGFSSIILSPNNVSSLVSILSPLIYFFKYLKYFCCKRCNF